MRGLQRPLAGSPVARSSPDSMRSARHDTIPRYNPKIQSAISGDATGDASAHEELAATVLTDASSPSHTRSARMDFTLTGEQQMIRDMCREFAEEEIKPHAEELDRTGAFPYEIVRKMAELGLLGLPFPEQYGGAGADYLSYCLALEEIGRGDASVGITMEAHTSLGATPFYLFGTEAQKQQYLVPLARGERLWSFGLTEPGAGSDSGGTETHAEKSKGMWTINGAKNFITNAGTEMSGGVTITAVTGMRADGRKEITNFIVPKGTKGYHIGKAYHKMGWRAS